MHKFLFIITVLVASVGSLAFTVETVPIAGTEVANASMSETVDRNRAICEPFETSYRPLMLGIAGRYGPELNDWQARYKEPECDRIPLYRVVDVCSLVREENPDGSGSSNYCVWSIRLEFTRFGTVCR